MYNIEINKKYYIFNTIKNINTKEFDSEDLLIDFLGRKVHYYFISYIPDFRESNFSTFFFYRESCHYKEKFLPMFSVVDKILYHIACNFECDSLLIKDSDNKIINIRLYKEIILKRLKIGVYDIAKKAIKNPQRGELLYSWRGPFHYRVDPVPGTGHCKYYHFYRRIKTSNEIKQNSIPEYKNFVRPNRRRLPTAWDNICRSTQKGWKEQSKKRKQWM